MKEYRTTGQMDLSDRIAIEAGISRGDSFRRIGELLHRHPTTIAHEVKTNRTWLQGCYAYIEAKASLLLALFLSILYCPHDPHKLLDQ